MARQDMPITRRGVVRRVGSDRQSTSCPFRQVPDTLILLCHLRRRRRHAPYTRDAAPEGHAGPVQPGAAAGVGADVARASSASTALGTALAMGNTALPRRARNGELGFPGRWPARPRQAGRRATLAPVHGPRTLGPCRSVTVQQWRMSSRVSRARTTRAAAAMGHLELALARRVLLVAGVAGSVGNPGGILGLSRNPAILISWYPESDAGDGHSSWKRRPGIC